MNRRRATLLGLLGVAGLGIVLAVILSWNGGRGGGDAPGSGTALEDDTGTISVEVPSGWGDVNLEPRVREEADVFRIEAAPDLDAFEARRDAPGMEFSYTDGLGEEHVVRQLDELTSTMGATARCDHHDRAEFSHRGFRGQADEYKGCGTDEARVSLIVAVDPAGTGLAVLAIQAASHDQRQLILDTFRIEATASRGRFIPIPGTRFARHGIVRAPAGGGE